MTMQTTSERLASPSFDRPSLAVTGEEWLRRLLLLSVVFFLLVGILAPLVPLVVRSLSDPTGRFVGLENYIRYCMPAKGFFRAIALLPLFAPPLVFAPPLAIAIGLVYLFGNKGLVTTDFFGFFERTLGLPLAYNIHLYGMNGIIGGNCSIVFRKPF